FAVVVDWFDILFETPRGRRDAKLTIAVNEDWPACHGRSIDAGDVRSCLCPLGADTDGVGLPRASAVAYVDIVVARGEVATGKIAQCYVAGAGCVIQERIVAGGCVTVAGCVEKKRKITNCRVVRAGCIRKECETTGSRVPDGG